MEFQPQIICLSGDLRIACVTPVFAWLSQDFDSFLGSSFDKPCRNGLKEVHLARASRSAFFCTFALDLDPLEISDLIVILFNPQKGFKSVTNPSVSISHRIYP